MLTSGLRKSIEKKDKKQGGGDKRGFSRGEREEDPQTAKIVEEKGEEAKEKGRYPKKTSNKRLDTTLGGLTREGKKANVGHVTESQLGMKRSRAGRLWFNSDWWTSKRFPLPY